MAYLNDRDNLPSGNLPDEYDRMLGALDGLPDVISTKPTTLRSITPVIGTSRMFTVQTFRQKDRDPDGQTPTRSKDTIFLECAGKDGLVRIALPPDVADAIARQRDSLTTRSRSRTAKAVAQARKEAGIEPGFMKNRGAGRRGRKSRRNAKGGEA